MQQFPLNPYKVGPPVVGTDFYGRNSLLFRVREALRTSNVALLQGQRRIGKTSFLKQLSVFLNELEQGQFVAALFDIQRYVQDTLPQFQLHLADAIAKELELPVSKLPEWEADHTLFRDTWLPQVYERLGDKQLVILVDEFDNLEGETAPQAMQTLIPFLGQLVSGEIQLKWVLTLGRQTGKLPIQYDPIIGASVQFRMSFLSLAETRQLVEKPTAGTVCYHPDAIARIYQLTNGQPHLTQAICSELFQSVVLEQERASVSVEDVDAVIPHTLLAYSGAIASIVRVPPIEERVLAAVAKLTAENGATNREEIINLLIENRVQINRDALTAALNSLLDWELLCGDLQAMRVSVELVRMWLVQNVSVEPSLQESLDIQHVLAQSRFELAEKLRAAGQYDRAIEDYKETLNYIPNHVEALRGLAEAYRLTGNLAERVDTLEKLYAFERGVFHELVEALAKYAEQAEEEGSFVVATEQYEKLIKLQNRQCWQQKMQANLINEYTIALKEVEDALKSELTKAPNIKSQKSFLVDLSRLNSARRKLEYEINVFMKSSERKSIESHFSREINSEHIIHKLIDIIAAMYHKKWGKTTYLFYELKKLGFEFGEAESKIAVSCFLNSIKNPLLLILPLWVLILLGLWGLTGDLSSFTIITIAILIFLIMSGVLVFLLAKIVIIVLPILKLELINQYRKSLVIRTILTILPRIIFFLRKR